MVKAITIAGWEDPPDVAGDEGRVLGDWSHNVEKMSVAVGQIYRE